jgi:hypothetical protein
MSASCSSAGGRSTCFSCNVTEDCQFPALAIRGCVSSTASLRSQTVLDVAREGHLNLHGPNEESRLLTKCDTQTPLGQSLNGPVQMPHSPLFKHVVHLGRRSQSARCVTGLPAFESLQ